MHGRLRASTLAELLVVMIVAGVVFMTVMDGAGLLGRHISLVSRTIADNGRAYESYRNLENIVALADSVVEHNGAVLIYREGKPDFRLVQGDSVLQVQAYGRVGWSWQPESTDTLLRNVARLRTCRASEFAGAVDTLHIDMATAGGDEITLSFVPVARTGEITADSISETEKDYAYE